jgi:hypothetical protein
MIQFEVYSMPLLKSNDITDLFRDRFRYIGKGVIPDRIDGIDIETATNRILTPIYTEITKINTPVYMTMRLTFTIQ